MARPDIKCVITDIKYFRLTSVFFFFFESLHHFFLKGNSHQKPGSNSVTHRLWLCRLLHYIMFVLVLSLSLVNYWPKPLQKLSLNGINYLLSLPQSLTTSPGEKTFEVKIESTAEQLTRIWIQVLDREDGSFLVRYRMYATYTDVHIHVLLKNKHVAKSPFILKGRTWSKCL